MTNYNFIGIGINSYQHLQPLAYAQADIEGLARFFCEEARVNPQQTLSFTDNSPWVNEQPTYPTKRNLLEWIESGFHNPKVTESGSSVLWFAYSGYAVQYNGEDYLLPIDARLADPVATGIPLRQIFHALRQQGAGKIVALLDMNRSGAVVGNGEVGEQTLELASQMGIATVLSCKPEEFSHETAALRHGMFSAAVLEALRYHRSNLTPELLNQYLGDRLKELSEHHWRPMQTPIMVLPSLAASRELILPSGEATKIHWQAAVPIGASIAGVAAATNKGKSVELPPFSSNGHSKSSEIKMGISEPEEPALPETSPEVVVDDLEGYPYSEDEEDHYDFDDTPIDEQTIFVGDLGPEIDPTEPAMMPTSKTHKKEASKGDRPWYLAGWQWLLLLLLLLLSALGWKLWQGKGGLFPIPQPIATELDGLTDAATNPDGTDTGNAGNVNNPNNNPNGAAGDASTTAENTGDAANNGAVSSPSPDAANGNGSGTTTNTGAAAGDDGSATSATPNGATATAGNGSTTAADTEANPSAVTDSATTAPADANAGNNASAPTVAPSVLTPNAKELQEQNAYILTEAGQVLRSSQASSFNDAITEARTIQPGTPLYNEARTQINRWSRVILDIAEARALQGDIAGAIAAAKLVPADVPQVYGIAQNSIQEWETQLVAVQQSRQKIVNAQEVIVANQAYSYSKAITMLKTIQPNEPIFNEARGLQDQWSRTIYLLANSRAAQGNFKLAVETAKLVPSDSPSYKSALAAIARWEKGVR